MNVYYLLISQFMKYNYISYALNFQNKRKTNYWPECLNQYTHYIHLMKMHQGQVTYDWLTESIFRSAVYDWFVIIINKACHAFAKNVSDAWSYGILLLFCIILLIFIGSMNFILTMSKKISLILLVHSTPDSDGIGRIVSQRRYWIVH